MWNYRNSRLRLAAFIIALYLLLSCNGAATPTPAFLSAQMEIIKNLPGVIRFAHSGNAMELVWYKQPYAGAYDQVTLKADGVMEHWQVIPNWATHGGESGHLFEEDRQELKDILNRLKDRPSESIPQGSLTIGLAFSWNGDSSVLYYSDLTCDDDLRRLLEIANATLQRDRNKRYSLADLCTPDGLASEPQHTSTEVSDGVLLPDSPPDLGRMKILTMSWSRPTMTDTYEMVSLYSDNSMYYDVYEGDELKSFLETKVNSSEQRDFLDLMRSLATSGKTPDSTGTEVVVSFPWEGDYHMVGLAKSNCPDKLRALFAIVVHLVQQESPNSEQLYNPCAD
jgi:hypothetical protein